MDHTRQRPSFSLWSVGASALGVLAAYHVPVPFAGNPLMREGPTPYRRVAAAPDNVNRWSVYEPVPRVIAEPDANDTLVVAIPGGGWHSGTIHDDWFIGHAFLGRAFASHARGKRIALLAYPPCTVPLRTAVEFYAGLAVFAVTLAYVLSKIAGPLRFWLALAAPCYAAVGALIWWRELATAGPFGVSDAHRVNASAQLRYVQESLDMLVRRYQPRHLVLAGHSAGGHFAAVLGVDMAQAMSTVPRVSVVGISGVYDVESLWDESRSFPGYFVRRWCIEPAFWSPTFSAGIIRRALSPTQQLLARPRDRSDAVGLTQRRHFHLVSARVDNEMLYAQADRFADALRSHAIGVTRHTGVGVGHGLGLIKSEALLELLVGIANDTVPL